MNNLILKSLLLRTVYKEIMDLNIHCHNIYKFSQIPIISYARNIELLPADQDSLNDFLSLNRL